MKKGKSNKFSRLLKYDFKRGKLDKILLLVEMIICMVLVCYAFTGLFTGINANKVFVRFMNYSSLELSAVSKYDTNYTEELYIEQVEIIKQIRTENEIGRIDLVPRTFGLSGKQFLSYDETVIKYIDLDIAKGNQLSSNYDGTQDIVLNDDYISEYKIGDIISSTEFDFREGNGFYPTDLKVVGFLEKDAIVYRPNSGTPPTSVDGVVSVPNDFSDYERISSSYIFNNIDSVEFAEKYNKELFVIESTDFGGEGVKYNSFDLKSIKSIYENGYKSTHDQIMSFMTMFAVISIFTLISSLMSITVVMYNKSKLRNTVMVKMGSTKGQMMAVKLVSMAIIMLLASIVAGLILQFITTMTGGMDDYIFRFEYFIYSVLIAGGLYLGAEGTEVVALYHSIKKEKS